MLADTGHFDRWNDAHFVSADPPGRVQPGQRLEFWAGLLGLRLPVRMTVGEVEPPHLLGLRVELPLGIVNDERVVLQPADEGRTLIRFN